MLAQVFFCKACERPFCTSLTAADIEAGIPVQCPLCGSEDVEERVATSCPTESRQTA